MADSNELKRKLLFALSFSDEGIELMLNRIKRDNPDKPHEEQQRLLKLELMAHGRSNIPSGLRVSSVALFKSNIE